MGSKNKAVNSVRELKGKGERLVGSITGNDELSAQGEGDQAEASLSQAADGVKEAANHVKDAFMGR